MELVTGYEKKFMDSLMLEECELRLHWGIGQAGRQAGIHADIHLSTPKLSRLAPVRFARPDNKMGTSVLSLSHMLLALPRLIYSRAADVMLQLGFPGAGAGGHPVHSRVGYGPCVIPPGAIKTNEAVGSGVAGAAADLIVQQWSGGQTEPNKVR